MTRIIFASEVGALTLQLDLDIRTRACVSRGRVLHLHRDGAAWSVCGRMRVADAPRGPLAGHNGSVNTFCPYCLTWAQRATP